MRMSLSDSIYNRLHFIDSSTDETVILTLRVMESLCFSLEKRELYYSLNPLEGSINPAESLKNKKNTDNILLFFSFDIRN